MTPASRSVSTEGAARPTLAFPQGTGGMAWTGERFVSQLRGEIRAEHHHRYLAAATVCAGLDVLDIASGEGFGSALLATVARSVVGVDRDAGAVAFAAGAYATPGLRFERGTCEAIPLADASVDAVVSFETIEHIEAHDRFLGEVRRVLRPGGFLLCSTPDRRVYRSGDEPNAFHLKELDRAEFEALLGRHFAGHAVVGQRVMAGSWVLPLEGEDSGAGWTLFETEDGASYRRTGGVASAVYLMGVAGDGALPALPLGGAVDASLRPGVLEVERRGAEERARAASVAADRARAEASRLRSDLAARDASLRDARSQAEAAKQRGDAERKRAEAAESEARTLRADGARLAAALNDAQSRLEASEAALAGRERALAQAAERERALMTQRDETRRELAACRAEVRRMEASRSWRVTAPLRAVGMLFRRGGTGSG